MAKLGAIPPAPSMRNWFELELTLRQEQVWAPKRFCWGWGVERVGGWDGGYCLSSVRSFKTSPHPQKNRTALNQNVFSQRKHQQKHILNSNPFHWQAARRCKWMGHFPAQRSIRHWVRQLPLLMATMALNASSPLHVATPRTNKNEDLAPFPLRNYATIRQMPLQTSVRAASHPMWQLPDQRGNRGVSMWLLKTSSNSVFCTAAPLRN